MNEINVTYTETEAELLMLSIIDIQERWDKNPKPEMSPAVHSDVNEILNSIIKKTKEQYEKRLQRTQ